MSRHVVVVGAGLSGLAAAMHLAGAGHRVTVVEREDVPGGREGTLSKDGFRFDTGPVVFTMLSLLEEGFAAVGSASRDHVSMQLLDPAYHTFYADGSSLKVRPGHEKMRAEIAAECGTRDAVAFDRFVGWLKQLNDVELPNFIDVNFDSPLGLFRNPAAAVKLLRLGAFGRLGKAISSRFEDERLHRAFSFQAMYAGMAPAKALALYAIITYMDSVEGVWFPEGGMHAVPLAMARAAEDAGVEFRYSSTVERVERGRDGRATGVRLAGGERIRGDAVVVTVDLPTAYRWLLPDVEAPRVVRRGQYSPSAVVWHVGVKGELPDGVGHHNIHFGHAWDEAFKDLMERGRPMADPSRFVAVPSLDDPGAAPEGTTVSTSWNRLPTCTSDGWTGARRDPGYGTKCCSSSPTSAIPRRSSPRNSSRPRTGSVRGWRPAPPSPWPTRSPRPVPSGHATSTSACPAWCSPDPGPRRVSASRWS